MNVIAVYRSKTQRQNKVFMVSWFRTPPVQYIYKSVLKKT